MSEKIQSKASESDKNKTATAKKKRKAVYVTLIALLLISNGYLFINNRIITEKEKEAQARAVDAEKLMLSAEENYNAALLEIDKYKKDLMVKDSLLKTSELELKEMKTEIDNLLDRKNISDNNLRKARNLLTQLQKERDNYYRQADSLKNINDRLFSENRTYKEQLVKEKEQYVQLKEENDELSKKVTKGSLLRATSIVGVGIRNNPNSNEDKTTNKAKKAIKIRISCTIEKNEFADAGNKVYYIVITAPNGDVLFDKKNLSGSFKHPETNVKIKYSTRIPFKYNHQDLPLSGYWNQTKLFSSGGYKIEIYCDGYLVGGPEAFLLK